MSPATFRISFDAVKHSGGELFLRPQMVVPVTFFEFIKQEEQEQEQ